MGRVLLPVATAEETDLCLRARDRGLRTWYEPRALAVHTGGGSGQSAETHAVQILNRVRLYRRRHGVLSSSAYFALAVASEASWVLRGSTRSRTALQVLVRRSARPAVTGAPSSWLPA